MSSSSKSPSRREAAAQAIADQKKGERRRVLMVLAPALILSLVIAFFVWRAVDQAKVDSKAGVAGIGVSSAQASCQKVVTKTAKGQGQHSDVGTPIDYPDAPPAMGPHWGSFLQGNQIRKFWTKDDRPELGYLVHSLEHGWTIVWYDEKIADDSTAMDQLERIAKQYKGNDLADKVMVAPWTKADGDAFPDGTNIALTHWSQGGKGSKVDGPNGVWQYCGKVSGQVVDQFVQDYPYSDSPEPISA